MYVYIHIYAFKWDVYVCVPFFPKEYRNQSVCVVLWLFFITFLGEVSMSSHAEPPLGWGWGRVREYFCKADK